MADNCWIGVVLAGGACRERRDRWQRRRRKIRKINTPDQTIAVIFAFDGVLCDIENVNVAAWERTFGELGWQVPTADCERAAEMDERLFLADWFRGAQVEGADIDAWVDRKRAIAAAMLAASPRLFPGARALIESLAASGGARLGAVGLSPRALIESCLAGAGLADWFAAVLGREDAEKTKPSPLAIQGILARLGVEPSRAFVLENDPNGMAAARAAGATPIAIGHRLPEGGWTGGAPYFRGLRDPGLLLALQSARGPEEPG